MKLGRLFKRLFAARVVAPRYRWAIFIASILYALCVLCVWAMVRHESERWWIATLLLFGPRVILAGPLILLILVAFFFHRLSLWILIPAAVFTLFPVLGFCVPWQTYIAKSSTGPTVRILTCNIHSYRSTLEPLKQLIAETKPDIVTLQEFKAGYEQVIFPQSEGWHVAFDHELCLASRYPITYRHLAPSGHMMEYRLLTPDGAIEYFNVHLSSPHDVFSEAVRGDENGAEDVQANSSRRLEEAQDLIRRTTNYHQTVLLSGDFDLPCDSPTYRRTLGIFNDAFSVAGWGFGWSYTHRTRIRIDHILTGPDWQCTNAWVGPDVGSPHRPLLADVKRNESPAK